MPATILVQTGDSANFSVTYFDYGDPAKKALLEAQWKKFNRNDPATGLSLPIWYRPTSSLQQVTADYTLPAGTPAGRYRIEIYVPGIHATARKALFTIAHNFRIENGNPFNDEPIVIVDMFDLFDVWHSLGEYDLDPVTYPKSGRVREYDLSMENPPAELSFGAVRWIPITGGGGGGGGGGGNSGPRFDSPVGEQAERNGPFPAGGNMFVKYPIWVGRWFDANPFLSWYSLGYHTGADLNLPGASDADKGKPIYSIADGVVTYAGAAGTWGNIVVVEHPSGLVTLPDGTQRRQAVYSRYGHVDAVAVHRGQEVTRGTQLAVVGLPPGATAGWHLHFDIGYTDLLKRAPASWPNPDPLPNPDTDNGQASMACIKKAILDNYVDPLRFIRDNH